MRLVKIYDTTLRDGTQAEYFSLSLADKIRIAEKLSQLGIHYIEGGWPGANPRDRDFFSEIHNYNVGHSRIAAFGSTHHKERPPESDPRETSMSGTCERPRRHVSCRMTEARFLSSPSRRIPGTSQRSVGVF